MKTFQNILAGLGGAIALNLLHESLKHHDPEMPRIDLLGEQALDKSLSMADTSIDADQKYGVTLGADLMSNALYYSMIGAGSRKHIWSKALLVGTAAGIGALELPKHMGLDDRPVTKTTKTKALTVGYYVFGALVTGCILKALRK